MVPSARATPENLAAELAAMLRTGVTIEACRKSPVICSLAIALAKASSDEPNDLAVAANHLIREACASVDSITEGPTAILLAVAPGYRGTLLKKRRTDAAKKLHITPGHLRDEREEPLLEAVADEVYAMDSAYRLRHRHRTEAEREPQESRLGIDWLAQHRSYRRIWSPVTGLRNDLIVLVNYLHEVKEAGRVPRPPRQIAEGSNERPVDLDMWADLSDRCASLTWRLAQYSRELDAFVEREGGLWILADAESEIRAADAIHRLDLHLPFGEADDVSWARTLLADTPHQELDGYVDRLIAEAERWSEFKAVWFDWAGDFLERDLGGAPIDAAAALATPAEAHQQPTTFLRVAPEVPQTECARWLAAGEEFIGLIDDDWYRVADWYRDGIRYGTEIRPRSVSTARV